MNGDDLPWYSPLDSLPGQGEVTRADVIASARTYLQTPYRHQHRLKGHGVDCAGLVICVARDLGLVAPDFDVTGYPREPDGRAMLEICDRFMTRTAMHLLQAGNVLVYRFEEAKGPQHMGIVGDYLHGGLSMIQALGTADGKGEVVEWNITRTRKGWIPVQAYKIPGVV